MKKNNKSGFTLLELLTVMAIMVIMMSIAAASYYGMSQGAAIRGSASNISTTLSLARQYAVNHRNRTHVWLWKDGTNSNYQVYVEAGRHIGANGSNILKLENPKSDASDLIGGDIYNLESKKSGIITNAYVNDIDGIWLTEIEVPGLTWNKGEAAAWSINSKESTTDGVEYEKDEYEIMFRPDGTVDKGLDVKLRELRGSAEKTVHVSLFGKIWTTTP